MADNKVTYTVPGISCGHCESSIRGEVEKIPGVLEVLVDLAGKKVTVAGEQFDDAAVRAAIDQAGYEVAA